jgi:hypothetical protein
MNFPKIFTKGPQNLADDTRVTRARWGLPLVLSLLLLSIGAAPAAADVRLVVQHEGEPAPEVVSVPAAREERTLARLNADPDVRYAAPDVTFHATATAPDFFGAEWGLENNGPVEFIPNAASDSDIDAPEAWDVTQGTGVKVAVVDTEVYTEHPDLAPNIAPDSAQDFVEDRGCTTYSVPTPDHGTHIAGIVAASADGAGTVGVAPQAQIVPVRALDNCGAGKLDWILPALQYAAESGAQVVVGSFATEPGPADEYLSDAFADLMESYPNTLFVFAAGNEANDDDANPVYPCSAPASNLLCVGASDSTDGPACTSNFGRQSVDLFAPGERIISTQRPATYTFMDGTSMAAPMAAGAAALVDAAAIADELPPATGAEVATTLRTTVDPKGAMAPLSLAGGRLNADRALPGPRNSPGGGDPEFPCDKDHDGLRDAVDACPDNAGSAAMHGCPDGDHDAVTDAADVCPASYDPGQADADHDGVGDVCDPTPRGPDPDGDGVPALDDACPTQAGTLADGCPAPAPYTPPPSTPPPSTPPSVTPPALKVVSVAVSARRCRAHGRCSRTAKVTVTLTRTAGTAVTVQKRVKRGHRWVWKRVLRRTLNATSSGRTMTVRRLGRGTYRVTASVSGAPAKRRTFRI